MRSFVSFAAAPTALGEAEQAFRHTVVREGLRLVSHSYIVPQAQYSSECLFVSLLDRAKLVEEEVGCVDDRIAEVEVTHI